MGVSHIKWDLLVWTLDLPIVLQVSSRSNGILKNLYWFGPEYRNVSKWSDDHILLIRRCPTMGWQ